MLNKDSIEKKYQQVLSDYSTSQNLYHMAMFDLADRLINNFAKGRKELMQNGINIDEDIKRINLEAQNYDNSFYGCRY